MPVAVPLIAAGVGAAGSIYSANQANKGQQAAANAAQQGNNASLAEQRRQFDISRQDQAPWLQAGTKALGSYADLLGQNGATNQARARQQFTTSPDYAFNLSEGQRALTARNAALGIQDSGAAQRSALKLGAGLASQQYDTYANRLAGLAGVGQAAANTNAQLGSNYANAVTDINQNTAQALGSSYQNQGAINGQLGQTLAGIGSGLINRWPYS